MNAHFSTEPLARRAARKLGTNIARIVGVCVLSGTDSMGWYDLRAITPGFYVEDAEVQGVTLRPWERLVFEGRGDRA